jgi:hypothetical protein
MANGIADLIPGWRILTDYGADATGNSDAAPAFSAAIASVPNGGTIVIPTGTFRLDTAPDWTTATNVLVWVAGGAILAGQFQGLALTGAGNRVVRWNGTATPLSTDNVGTVLGSVFPNPVSSYADGSRVVFPLFSGQARISARYNAADVSVIVNGLTLEPYVAQVALPWMSVVDQAGQFRTVAPMGETQPQASVLLYRPPASGSRIAVRLPNSSTMTTASTQKYPYTSQTITLGD